MNGFDCKRRVVFVCAPWPAGGMTFESKVLYTLVFCFLFFLLHFLYEWAATSVGWASCWLLWLCFVCPAVCSCLLCCALRTLPARIASWNWRSRSGFSAKCELGCEMLLTSERFVRLVQVLTYVYVHILIEKIMMQTGS